MRRGFRPRTIAGGTARFEVRSLTLRAVPSKQSAKVRSPSRLRSAHCISSIPFKTCNGPWLRESIRRCQCSSLRKLRSRISWRTSKRSSPCRHRVQRANKMAPTHPAGQRWPIIALGAFLSVSSSPVLAQSPAAQRGLTFVRVHCAQCHAIDKVSDSPLAIARNAMPSTRSAIARSPSRPRSARCISNSRSRACAAAWPKALSPIIRRCRNSGSIRISSRMSWRICRHSSPDAKPGGLLPPFSRAAAPH